VIVTLKTTGSRRNTRTYPWVVPFAFVVPIRRQCAVYDETKINCDQAFDRNIIVGAQESKDAAIGVRFPSRCFGDSLPAATYTVRAVVLTEGTAQVLLDAGSASIGQ